MYSQRKLIYFPCIHRNVGFLNNLWVDRVAEVKPSYKIVWTRNQNHCVKSLKQKTVFSPDLFVTELRKQHDCCVQSFRQKRRRHQIYHYNIRDLK